MQTSDASSSARYPLDRHGLIGTAGYTVPDLSDCKEFLFEEVGNVEWCRNIQVTGHAPGKNNRIILSPSSNLASPLRINVGPNTSEALVFIGPNCTVHGVISIHSSRQRVIISGGLPSVGHYGYFSAQMYNPDQLLFIGYGSTTNGSTYTMGGTGTCIIIGDDCMFANNVWLQTTDSHAIVDLASGKWRNKPADIVLEPHVWLGQSVSVSKGVVMGLGSIAAAHALVVRSTERFCSVGGVPAKVLATGIAWDRKGIPSRDLVDKMKMLDAEVKPFRGQLRVELPI